MTTPAPFLSLLVGLSFLAGCSDGPCADVDGPVLFAWDNSVDHRLEGTNPLAFDTIGAAVDAATPGTTICISSGIWQEEISVSKPDVHLRGAGSERTIIEPRYPFSDLGLPRPLWSKLLLRVSPLRASSSEEPRPGLRLTNASDTRLRDVQLRTNTVGLHGTSLQGLTAEPPRAHTSIAHSLRAPWTSDLSSSSHRPSGRGERPKGCLERRWNPLESPLGPHPSALPGQHGHCSRRPPYPGPRCG